MQNLATNSSQLTLTAGRSFAGDPHQFIFVRSFLSSIVFVKIICLLSMVSINS